MALWEKALDIKFAIEDFFIGLTRGWHKVTHQYSDIDMMETEEVYVVGKSGGSDNDFNSDSEIGFESMSFSGAKCYVTFRFFDNSERTYKVSSELFHSINIQDKAEILIIDDSVYRYRRIN